MNNTTRIAVFASGKGSNAANIIEYFQNHISIEVSLLVTNSMKSGLIKLSEDYSIPCLMVTNEDLVNTQDLATTLKDEGVDYIVLAGFLRKIPDNIISLFKSKILNIHPSLLPKYGGKGMYGRKVHEAVSSAGEKKTGITIHIVDEVYDNGEIIFQKEIDLSGTESIEEIETMVKGLEHSTYPLVIEQFILDNRIKDQ